MEKNVLAKICIKGQERENILLPMQGNDADGNLYTVDNKSLMKNGKRFLPVMGEFHFSRWEPENWEEEVLKMRSGGIEILATYTFWIYHEEERGVWDFTGCRDLRAFLLLCKKLHMPVWLRIGPWAHGECRNGGFPDWLMEESKEKGFELRSNAPEYLRDVREYFTKLSEQCQGMMCKDGGPVLGIQIENEYGHVGGTSDAAEGAAHIMELKKLARELGFDVPYYTATGWGGAHVVDGETLPVLGGYVDAPWELSIEELPASENFLFLPFHNDVNIGSDSGHKDHSFRFSIQKNPYLTAELGAGIQVTSHRRTYPFPEDIEANALCMLGSGAVLIGYYMYHGGIHPDGKNGTLEETSGDAGVGCLPKKSYDFQTCIGESGEISESYGKLKKIHLLIKDFGEALCGSRTILPETVPDSPEDMELLRASLRYREETGEGFLFLNGHQRKRRMSAHRDFSVELHGLCLEQKKSVLLEHLYLESGRCGVIPFGIPAGGVTLTKTNAFLLCRMGEKLVCYADDSYKDRVYMEWSDGKPHQELVILLSAEEAERVYRFGDALYMTERMDSCLIEKEDGLWLLTKHPEEQVIRILSDGTRKALDTEYFGDSGAEDVQNTTKVEYRQSGESFGESGELLYREYELHLEGRAVSHQAYLSLEIRGDRAEVYQDGRLADDWFTTGMPWHVALGRLGYPEKLVVRVYDSANLMTRRFGDGVYFDLPVEKGCSLDQAKILLEYCNKVKCG